MVLWNVMPAHGQQIDTNVAREYATFKCSYFCTKPHGTTSPKTVMLTRL